MPDPPRQTPASSADEHAVRGRLLRSAGTVGGLTLVSRLFGYARDAILTGLLGTSDVGDAFAAAFQISNALRRLAGEGNLTAAFLPVFSRVEHRTPGRVWVLADRFHSAVLVVVSALAAAGVATAPWIVPLVYGGYAGTPGKLALTVHLAQLLFAYVLFISLSAVLMAVLNARDRFAAAAFTPVLLNVSIITLGGAAWWTGAVRPVYWIVGGVVLGGLAQWLFLVPFARRIGMRFRFGLDLEDRDLREVGRLILPRLLGVGVIQVNIFVGQVLAASLGQGAVVSLYYAGRVQELTLGVFAVSVATVVLPTMSRQGAAGDLSAMRETISFALRQVSAITVPAAVGVFVLRHEIIAVLFQRGEFDAASTALTAAALAGFAVGLAAVAAVRIAAPGFYALHDTRTPVYVAMVGVAVNLGACLALRGPLGNAGIALASSLAAAVSAVLLLILLRRRLRRLDGRSILASLARIGVAAAAMGWVVTLPLPLRRAAGFAGGPDLLVRVLAGVAFYGVLLTLLRAPEVHELRTILVGRRPDTLLGGDHEDSQGGDGGIG